MTTSATGSATASHATIRLVALPTRASLEAAHDAGPSDDRKLVYISLHASGELDTPLGWGECSALNRPTYTPEWAEGAFDLFTSGDAIDPASAPMAAAAIEMAELDAELRRSRLSLAERLGTDGRAAPAGAVVGLGTIPEMLDQVDELVTAGYRRIKCKIAPGRVIEPLRAVATRFPGIELHADANGSLGIDDLGLLLALRDLGVTAVEQPFAVGDQASAARLVADSDLAVIADEAITIVDDVWAVARDQAATAVAIKPPRAGGLRSALRLIDAAALAGLHCAIGGMLESGLGRHQLAAVAPLTPFAITGDLSPARRWLAVDPFADLDVLDGNVAAPSVIGIAGDPDLDILDAHTVRSWTGPMPTIEIKDQG